MGEWFDLKYLVDPKDVFGITIKEIPEEDYMVPEQEYGPVGIEGWCYYYTVLWEMIPVDIQMKLLEYFSKESKRYEEKK